ncbi:MAG: hypothetical protein IPO92_23480 [Saprospiraceae bacterium]|nr:hypothetical protein [Saprospiraceae bacterium]
MIRYTFASLFKSKIKKNEEVVIICSTVFLFSCKSGVDAHKAAIEELGTNWDAATAAATGFSEGLTKDVTGYTEAAAAMTLSEDAVKGLKPDMAAKYAEATAAYKAATVDAYAPIQTELNDFVTMWTEKAAGVTARLKMVLLLVKSKEMLLHK